MNSVQMVTTRRERLKQEFREDILAAARDLFATEGYPSVSIRKIADRSCCLVVSEPMNRSCGH